MFIGWRLVLVRLVRISKNCSIIYKFMSITYLETWKFYSCLERFKTKTKSAFLLIFSLQCLKCMLGCDASLNSNRAKISEWDEYRMSSWPLPGMYRALGSAYLKRRRVWWKEWKLKQSAAQELIIQQLTAPLHLLSLLAGWIKYSRARGIYWLSALGTHRAARKSRVSVPALYRARLLSRDYFYYILLPWLRWQIGSISWTRNAGGRGGKKLFARIIFIIIPSGFFQAPDRFCSRNKTLRCKFPRPPEKGKFAVCASARAPFFWSVPFHFPSCWFRVAQFTNPTGSRAILVASSVLRGCICIERRQSKQAAQENEQYIENFSRHLNFELISFDEGKNKQHYSLLCYWKMQSTYILFIITHLRTNKVQFQSTDWWLKNCNSERQTNENLIM